jgi:beta-glucanase (GH16 family)
LFLLFSVHQFFGQTPANDPTWLLQDGTNSTTDLSDEFNSGTVPNSTKWHVFDCSTDLFYEAFASGSGFSPSMTTVSGGYLNLRTDGTIKSPACNGYSNSGKSQYNTGGVISPGQSYTYGYVEMYAQLPGFVDGSGVAHADKFWPAFWLTKQSFTGTCLTTWDEIDMMDQDGDKYSDAKSIGSGYWSNCFNTTPCCYGPKGGNACCSQLNNGTLIHHPNILCYNNQTSTTNYHKYAVEWNAGKIIFYFDDAPIFENYPPTFAMSAMQLVIDFQIPAERWDPSCGCEVPYTNFYSGFPFTSSANSSMSLDYLRYYKLKLDCSNTSNILTNTDLSNFFTVTATTPSVKSDITIGNGTSSISMGSTDLDFFRAVNTITVKGDFTVPLGATLALLPTACN